ncbi:G-type lectin S-receptor-like serine/threonine-protein kinase At4g03230 [Eucalyptus grandis]|uniref:G-type lectin S-receptor-like serine/threonine-protein kinase At4g03230 n=1 Tax=Eucalyptus grandis TaxID=71139 RepID=UPI00192EDB6A|nr:G-type lectin S-receptor-like serine/threonine-protein kinase At4g03230 [Eucalyptus grandis]
MRCSNNFKRLLLFMIVLPFCSSSDTLGSTVSRITYPGTNTLVSAGKWFELGFFSPNRISNSRSYVGIWCYRSDTLIVAWVANRSAPVVGGTASFGLLNGDLQLWNDGQLIWSTNATSSNSSTRFAKLLDTGNLVLTEDDGSNSPLWQSFDLPTNTFLPGMRMTDDFKLTSWASQDDPKEGNFTFRRDQEGDTRDYDVIRGVTPYWKSGVYGNFIPPDRMFQVISSLLSKSTTDNQSLAENYWLVMNNDGQIQYFKQVNESKPFWFQPASRCSVFNACPKFQSCNDKNGNKTMCKCLPGFKLRSGGCLGKSQMFERTSDFLSLKMMKTGNPGIQTVGRPQGAMQAKVHRRWKMPGLLLLVRGASA